MAARTIPNLKTPMLNTIADFHSFRARRAALREMWAGKCLVQVVSLFRQKFRVQHWRAPQLMRQSKSVHGRFGYPTQSERQARSYLSQPPLDIISETLCCAPCTTSLASGTDYLPDCEPRRVPVSVTLTITGRRCSGKSYSSSKGAFYDSREAALSRRGSRNGAAIRPDLGGFRTRCSRKIWQYTLWTGHGVRGRRGARRFARSVRLRIRFDDPARTRGTRRDRRKAANLVLRSTQ
ncbi:uncharacterized protein C8Q71DRAFT_792671 [Rhodofomes roseus]|uniref:Uncharacterized protein n=1 Tax=Rhodofomes roseus TaxID=34475 RepID=A0ABQ8JXZ4_9APHY|nr:uncharacterized protein C8Q71DRAFT_792671 [Rhodofomes roseus]KAH9828730.1 hypothetical protein C8Q71DRAFT_792671 [Rhodofomes roseus]